MSESGAPSEAKTLVTHFRGRRYRISLDHAHMLNRRGHLRSHGWGADIAYYVEDDRMIEVCGEPLADAGAAR